MHKITESPSQYDHLESKAISEILHDINGEDKTVAFAVEKAIPAIEKVVEKVVEKLKNGGRLFYIGAGTSGRLGILDASECPPTYGVPKDMVIGIIAGGDAAIRSSVESAEDSTTQCWKDLQKFNIDTSDILIGIAASGTTPYVIQGLETARTHGIATGCITCNPDAPITKACDYPIEVIVGPEYVTGSTRMKSGTAQKMVLNMITTATMIQLGRVKGNKMVNMQLTNEKLIDRGTKMIMEATDLAYDAAKKSLLEKGSVREAVDWIYNGRK
ncbi:MAG: N-acetylmuramic acid 6-phosphate etherase [Lewinellaceae bacterium]|nr:N-acetylmuramic acid 6-phosphate etherase [Lewinellaceae bacterium]